MHAPVRRAKRHPAQVRYSLVTKKLTLSSISWHTNNTIPVVDFAQHSTEAALSTFVILQSDWHWVVYLVHRSAGLETASVARTELNLRNP